jgi:D-aminopeptidase
MTAAGSCRRSRASESGGASSGVRASDLGITIGPIARGPLNAITDVPGIRVGHTTLISGEGPLVVGRGPVRTGVTVIVPHDGNPWDDGVFAGSHRLNGNGELTGLEWIRESGLLSSPIGLTNTHSLGVVRDALIAEEVRRRPSGEYFFGLPVVGETFDGLLNDTNGFHVTREHVFAAMAGAAGGVVAEGSVGGGTGMVCHGFKGGIGTSSRVVAAGGASFTVGVLVQANHGRRDRLRVNGIPVGERIPESQVPVPRRPTAAGAPAADPRPLPDMPPGSGSIIGIVATDAPLSAVQCRRVAQRAALGVARSGGAGEHTSGDLFLAFATPNRLPIRGERLGERGTVTVIGDGAINDLFYAVIDATEEAILNALLAAGTMTGRDGITAHAIGAERLLAALRG